MKQLIFLLIIIIYSNIIFAQSELINTINNKNKAVHCLLHQQTKSFQAARITSGIASERVIAQSKHDSLMGAIQDSVALSYTAGLGSTYDYNTMIYPYNYPYNTSPMYNLEGVFVKPQVLFDSYMHYTISPTTLTYGLFQYCYANYDFNNNLTFFRTIYTDSITYSNTNNYNSFNASNNISSGKSVVWLGGLQDSAFKQYFTYNTFNKIVEDSIYEYHAGSWHLAEKTYYTYNSANNISRIDVYGNVTDTTFTAILTEQLQYLSTYDASNRLINIATNIYNGTILAPSARDTFQYTGSHPFHTAWRDYQYDNINGYWAPMFNMTKKLNTSGYPDTITIQGFDSLLNAWVPQTLQIATYNASNNPTTLTEYDYNFTAYPNIPNTTTYYYYSTYTNTTQAPQISINPKITIYPNPATNSIHIQAENNAMGFIISMYNIIGQLMYQEKLPANQLSTEIEINNLKPQTYQLLIQDLNGKLITSQHVVKE